MNLINRQGEILALIRSHGQVEVDALAQIFGVTTQTIRRDLNELCQNGLASRTHGGASQPHSVFNLPYADRNQISAADKSRIGIAAARLIPDNCSVMLNIGTTTEQVARALYAHRDLVVISNNINVINILSGSPSKELVLAGGTVRQSDGAIVGADAVEFIGRYKADFAIIGTSALDADGAVLDYDGREVSVARAILRNARTGILVADAAKFAKTAPVRICDVADLAIVVTDSPPPEEFQAACAAADTSIVIADQDREELHHVS